MSKPNGITGSQRKGPASIPTAGVQMRRLASSPFCTAVTVTLILALCGQLLIISLFHWI